jgi:hypothetical protein
MTSQARFISPTRWPLTCLALCTLATVWSLNAGDSPWGRQPTSLVFSSRDLAVSSPWTGQQREQATEAWRHRPSQVIVWAHDGPAHSDAMPNQRPVVVNYHVVASPPPQYDQPANQDIIGNIHRILDGARSNQQAYEARQQIERSNQRYVSESMRLEQASQELDRSLERLRLQFQEIYRRH